MKTNIPKNTFTKDYNRLARLVAKLNKEKEITVYLYYANNFSINEHKGYIDKIKFLNNNREYIKDALKQIRK
jgi:hypothetical protein